MKIHWLWWVTIASFIIALVSSLISYFAAKGLAKWIKNVKIISQRKDLTKSLKLTEVVKMVKTICHHYQIPLPEIGIYPSREINAFATGRPGNSLIALSSGLVNEFSIEEMKGVIAHEISHLLHNDLKAILLVQGFFDFIFHFLNILLFIGVNLWINGKRDKKERSFGAEILLTIVAMVIFQIVSTILRLITVLPVIWFIKRRELKADRKAARIVGIDRMIISLKKLLSLENKDWVVDGIDLTEDGENMHFNSFEKDSNDNQQEPNSISLLKINSEKKKRDWFLELFRTHPPLEKRIKILEKLKEQSGGF